MRCLLTLLLGFICSSVKATPWGMPGEADIRSTDGELRICLPEDAVNSVEVDSVWVSEAFSRNGKHLPMWEFELGQNGSPVRLAPGGCLSYGAVPPGYQEQVVAKSLTFGQTYYVRMNLVVVNPHRQSTLFYDGTFCVGQGHEGMPVYRQYRYERDGSVVKAAC